MTQLACSSTTGIRHHTRPLGYSVPTALGDLRAFTDRQPDGEAHEPFPIELGGAPVDGEDVSSNDLSAGDVVQVRIER